MSDIDLTAIEERAEAATDGPWSWNGDDLRGTLASGSPTRPLILSTAARGGLDPLSADREFIAEARQDVEALIAEVRRLRSEAVQAQAQALRAAADELYGDDGPGHPLSTATWLRERADRLENDRQGAAKGVSDG